jgi:hypothetical protein
MVLRSWMGSRRYVEFPTFAVPWTDLLFLLKGSNRTLLINQADSEILRGGTLISALQPSTFRLSWIPRSALYHTLSDRGLRMINRCLASQCLERSLIQSYHPEVKRIILTLNFRHLLGDAG